MASTATRLESLILKEISAVDSPANEAPGFAIFKSKDGGTPAVVAAIAKAVCEYVEESTNVAAEEVAKGMVEALAPYTAISSALLQRVERMEKLAAANARKSIDGQEAPAIVAGENPTLGDTFALVAKGASVELR